MGHHAWWIWGDFKMRIGLIVVSWLLITSCFAAKVALIEDDSLDEASYSLNGRPVGVDSNASLTLETGRDFRFPVNSRIRSGKVVRHIANNTPAFTQTIFVIGDDEASKSWLCSHAERLKTLHALGFVTNVQTASNLHALEELAGIPLQAVDVDGLSELLQVEHYPYVVQEGVVWQ